MANIRKLPNGRYQLDYQDKRLGIPRTKSTFDTKQEAQEYKKLLETNGKRILVGHKKRRLFGEALADYLVELQATQATQNPEAWARTQVNVRALRHPALCTKTRRWIRLEELPLEKTIDTEIDIADGMKIYTADKKAIIKRSRLHQCQYEQRNTGGKLTWYKQPDPEEGARPPIREEIKDPALIAELNKTAGRGPVRPDTLRLRQALVSRVLAWAHKERYTDNNMGELIKRESPVGRRAITIVTYAQFFDMLIHLKPGYDIAVLAAAFIGWRKSNILGLTWDRVEFPVYKDNKLIRPGFAYVAAGHNDDAAQRTKNKNKLIHPMTEFTEQIFRAAWDQRSGPLVFHCEGKQIGDIRKNYATAKRRAGITGPIPPWHGWRHHFATWLGMSGATPHEMMQAGGWNEVGMTAHYTQHNDIMQAAHLIPTIDRMIANIKGAQ